MLGAVHSGPLRHAWAWSLALASTACVARASPVPEPCVDDPAVFVEALPQLTTEELFGALRELDVDVWVADDMRLGVRMHDARSFVAAC
ncbi:MAG TPA: hypothetical protein VM869_26515, partial [Enhygromyxa sp.]|nr:hypothetical protein [Enhygromyxa sp.]